MLSWLFILVIQRGNGEALMFLNSYFFHDWHCQFYVLFAIVVHLQEDANEFAVKIVLVVPPLLVLLVVLVFANREDCAYECEFSSPSSS